MKRELKEYEIQPTIKQKKYLDKLGEGGGNKSKYDAALEAGYSEAVAVDVKNKIEKSRGFQQLVEQYLPDDKLLKVHEEGLAATRGEEPDYATRHRYLDTAFKVKGAYAPEKHEVVLGIIGLLHEPEREG